MTKDQYILRFKHIRPLSIYATYNDVQPLSNDDLLTYITSQYRVAESLITGMLDCKDVGSYLNRNISAIAHVYFSLGYILGFEKSVWMIIPPRKSQDVQEAVNAFLVKSGTKDTVVSLYSGLSQTLAGIYGMIVSDNIDGFSKN